MRTWLLREQPRTVDRGRLEILDRELTHVVTAGVTGPVVEFGSYRGGSAAYMRAVLDALGDDREIHTYDAFAGMPAPADCDGTHLPAGALCASVDDVYRTHDTHGLRRPIVHEGWFEDTVVDGLPVDIAFAYLDADRYESTLTCLTHAVPRLAPDAIMVLDDFADPATSTALARYPGVMRACEEYFGTPLPVACISLSGELGLGRYRAPALVAA